MKHKLLAFIAGVLTATGAWAKDASVAGRIVDASTKSPLSGVTVIVGNVRVVTDNDGKFLIANLPAGDYQLATLFNGYFSSSVPVTLTDGKRVNLPSAITINPVIANAFQEEQEDLLIDEETLNSDENASQSVTSLTGANDNIYYSACSYDFSAMYFRYRGYDSQYQTTYMNGLDMNDPIRGRFSFSSLGGMTSRAFRNKTTSVGLEAADYGFSAIGGSSNISTITSEYATGFNGSVAYTNANYMLRAMATYSTGINPQGWGLTVSAVGRYANEGVIEGTFYNSAGLFLSAEKVFNPKHSLTFTAYGAPTQRATASATYEEAYQLAGYDHFANGNLYNPNWGYWEGKKRSTRVVESFDPTAMLTWLYKKSRNTTLTTSAMFRSVNYSTSALNYYNALDPRPDYYRNLPSNFYDTNGQPTAQSEYIANLWRTNQSIRQVNWERMYQANYFNNLQNEGKAPEDCIGASYILEKRHSNNIQASLGSLLNTRLNDFITLQGGAQANYTKASYYKTVKDLMGGAFWTDIDPFSDREMTIAPDLLQNDLDNPNRRVTVGDKFGYDYDLNAVNATAFLQNRIALAHWDINYGLQGNYLQFNREGRMRNGRAPENSLGTSKTYRFVTGRAKAGATYKIDGRNYLMAHAEYGTNAPLIESVFISPRINDKVIDNPKPECILSGDITYGWSYSRFRGQITGYWTEFSDAVERTAFYDDNFSGFTNYVISGVRRCNKGVELGVAYKILPSLTATVAGTVASYRYKNNPQGTRSFENGLNPDTTQVVYLKNYRVGGTPQVAFNIGLDWQAPKSWFFGINASWMRESYVKLSPVYHEALPTLWQSYPTEEALQAKIAELSAQGKMNNAFVLNCSIGKFVNISRKVAMNFNLNIDNILNNTNIMNNAYQQGRMDTKTWSMSKYPDKISYAQGTKVFLNIGIRF